MKLMINIITAFLLVFSVQACNLISAAGFSSHGQPIKKIDSQLASALPNTQIVDHSQWDQLLKQHVQPNGLVDYQGFSANLPQLEAYLKMLSKQNPNQDWSVQELLAYYINLYNAATIRLIVENYPVNSIKDIDSPWTKGRVAIGDKMLSLGGIENGILRKMNEPRIHFAINCASVSCPKLLNEAYTASKINEQLNTVTKEFIDSTENEISENSARLSTIFDWYKNDFKVNGKTDVIGYINQFSDIKIKPNANISFKNYNWKLNSSN
ncbi:MAG: hypothetical protein CL526_02955 [Aequorivita sp.]|nr:hypothetical protein [Aequorivita sp.]|tara:strand:- start:6781 stop:7581 length:801 start_codon:yes stop_codon:yes gene_type:complete